MKAFFTFLGAFFFVVLLIVAGAGLYAYKHIGSSLSKLDEAAIEGYLSKHQASPQVTQVLKRIGNAAKINQSMPAQVLALGALSVLSLPDAVTSEQQKMLEDAASRLEKADVTMHEFQEFQQKYQDVLPQRTGAHMPVDTAAASALAPAAIPPTLLPQQHEHGDALENNRVQVTPTKNDSGCSVGRRAALMDVQYFPDIAACAATWERASLRATKTKSLCGEDVLCVAPADACADGWHVCGDGAQGAQELRQRLSAEQCAQLADGRFVAALSDTDCADCGVGGGHGAVCCGRSCVQQHGSCVWPHQTAWAGLIDGHINACGDIEMPLQDAANGVLCCVDKKSGAGAPAAARRNHR